MCKLKLCLRIHVIVLCLVCCVYIEAICKDTCNEALNNIFDTLLVVVIQIFSSTTVIGNCLPQLFVLTPTGRMIAKAFHFL